MPDEMPTSTFSQTTTSSNFDGKAEKWWESKLAFLAATITPVVVICAFLFQMRIDDARQQDAISTSQAQLTLFINGDFKDSQQRVTDLTTSVNTLTVEVAKLETIINERIPPKK